MYAVVDVETTGFSPRLHDRVVELAVVHVDADGWVEGEWCTLLNPDRDMGPQHVHGISAADAAQAPRFSDVADEVAALLAGRVLVAHNIAFDGLFLSAEYARMQVEVPQLAERGVCTMHWAGLLLPNASRTLRDCCARAGVPLNGVHSAASDARGAAALLGHYLQATHPSPPWDGAVEAANGWPPVPVPAVRAALRTRTGFADRGADPTLLARTVDFMPRVDSSALADPYLAVLDVALADRYLSADELAALWSLADHLRLSRGDVLRLHSGYLQALARLAVADDLVTEEELLDLVRVSRLLGLPDSSVESALGDARFEGGPTSAWSLEMGQAVVFTGSMPEPREQWFARAAEHGFEPRSTVTKDVTLVVAADPASLSGKAKKARGYGIPVVGIDEFRAWLGYPPPSEHVNESPVRRGNQEEYLARAIRSDLRR
ncbi:exonuclease domain-containing protein [Aquipuribacter sp. MA13-6]